MKNKYKIERLEATYSAAKVDFLDTSYDYDGVHEALVIDANRKDVEAYARKHTEPTYLTKNK